MIKSLVSANKSERERFTVPRSVQETIRRRPADPPGQRQTNPPGRKPAAAQPRPQERMRQKAKAEAQTRRAQAGRVSTPSRPGHQPAPRQIAGTTPASPGNQSINPIKERPRRSFVPKEKPAGGAFIPKTRQTAGTYEPPHRLSTAKSRYTAAARIDGGHFMRLVPFTVIQEAKKFDTEAVEFVFRHFAGFITSKCQRNYTDEYGNERSYVDDDLRYQAEIALFRAIAGFQFREPPDDFMP